MIRSQTTLRVRYVETDNMGVVYHGNYFAWFEVGRVHLLDELGFPYKELEAQGYLLPVLEAHATFKNPARFDDRVTVACVIPEAPRARVRLEYEVTLGEKRLVTGYTVHGFMSPDGRAMKPPEAFLRKIEAAF